MIDTPPHLVPGTVAPTMKGWSRGSTLLSSKDAASASVRATMMVCARDHAHVRKGAGRKKKKAVEEAFTGEQCSVETLNTGGGFRRCQRTALQQGTIRGSLYMDHARKGWRESASDPTHLCAHDVGLQPSRHETVAVLLHGHQHLPAHVPALFGAGLSASLTEQPDTGKERVRVKKKSTRRAKVRDDQMHLAGHRRRGPTSELCVPSD